MSDKYGYIGIETLLNFCSNQKDHCVTPNDFMRMNRVKIDERPHGEWMPKQDNDGGRRYVCSNCGEPCYTLLYTEPKPRDRFCLWCGADMRKEGEAEWKSEE